MSSKVTKSDWKSSLGFFLSHRASYTTDKTLGRNQDLLNDFIRFTEPLGLILDVGCGSGEIRKYGNLERYIGIDPVEARLTKFPFIKGMGEFLPFKNSAFDCAITMATLDHCWSPEQVMTECGRVLKRNGRIFVWLKVTRTNVIYKLRRLLHYIKILDYSSLATSIRSNINTLIKEDTDFHQYGHTQSFTERSLLKLISSSFDITRVRWHDQDVFIVGQKRGPQ